MLENILRYDDTLGLARKKNKNFISKLVAKEDINKLRSQGWEVSKNLKTGVQVIKPKPHEEALDDKVWSLFHKMKFSYLSGSNGAVLKNPKNASENIGNISVVAIDSEVALFVKHKSFATHRRWSQFQEEINQFVQLKEPIAKSLKNLEQNGDAKKQAVFLFVLNNVTLSEEDRALAKKSNIIVFDEHDVSYYENLANHLGPAAKYQILADMLPGKTIPGLTIKVPAIKTKMGGYNCYTFSISPDYLLKISYVSHRSKGKASDINTYQRMLAKNRLKKIKEYISDDGIFPTNIILNFEKDRLGFQKVKQEGDSEELEVGVLGWLDIKPAYKSAWIVDGQHRLFAYSGHMKALKSKLSVLAFEGLKPSKQAELFIDINAKQKSVKQSLLQELFAELRWDADDPLIRISAIISKAIQDLNNDPECRLYQRVQTTDGPKDFIRCITLTSLFGQIEKKGFFVAKEKNGTVSEYGPFWQGDENSLVLKRSVTILKFWINKVADLNEEWWNLGSAAGGGIAMNDGIAALLATLRSVFEHLEKQNNKLNKLKTPEVCSLLEPFAIELGAYLSSLDEIGRKSFRDLRGEAGVGYRTRQCQQGIRQKISDFNPDGLDHWIQTQKQETNKSTKELIDKIEVEIQKFIVDELKSEYGIDNEGWWYEGVPPTVRSKATSKMEDDKNKRGGKEYYFDLIEYKKIVLDNWNLFEKTFAFGKGNKEKKTDWLDFINETRKIVAHASSGKTVSLEDFHKVEEYHNWVTDQIIKASQDDQGENSDLAEE